MTYPNFTASVKANGHSEIRFIIRKGDVCMIAHNKLTGEKMVMPLGPIEELDATFFHALFSMARRSDQLLKEAMSCECREMEAQKCARPAAALC